MFQAWLVKMAKIAASSAPSVLPGKRPRKNVTVNDRKPRTGTDCSTSSTGISTISARRLLAASVAYAKVNTSEAAVYLEGEVAAYQGDRTAQTVFFNVSGTTIVADWIPGARVSSANGLVTCAAILGVASTYKIFGTLIDRFDWPGAFLATAGVTVLVTGLWMSAGADGPKGDSVTHPGARFMRHRGARLALLPFGLAVRLVDRPPNLKIS